MTKKVFYPIFAILFVIFSAADASTIGFGPNVGIGYPVKITLSDGTAGTGFYLNDDPFTYLVTAKHILFKNNSTTPTAVRAELTSYGRGPKDVSPNIIQLDIEEMFKTRNLRSHETQDVAVGRIAEIETKNETKLLKLYKWARSITSAGTGIVRIDTKAAIKKISDVFISNDVFVYGYPSLIGIKYFPYMNYDRPLLRKGIVAGVNLRAGSIIVDAAVNEGYRGGPVIEVNPTDVTAKPKLIGIISGQLPFAENQMNRQSGNSGSESSNSGFAVVIPVDTILEVLWE